MAEATPRVGTTPRHGIPYAADTDLLIEYPAVVDAPRAVLLDSLITPVWFGTQAEYDAIVTKDPSTLYVVTG